MSSLQFSNIRRNIIKEGSWVFIGQILTALAALVGIRLITEFVPPKVYGSVTLLIGITTLGRNLFCTPLLQACYRFYPDAERYKSISELRKIITDYLRKSSCALASLMLLIGAISCFITGRSFMGVLALVVYFIATVAQTLEINLLSAARRQKFIALWESLNAWCQPLFAITLVIIFGATTQSVIWGYCVATASIYFIIRILPFTLEGKGKDKHQTTTPLNNLQKNILHYSLPLAPLALVGWVTSLSDRYIIGNILGLEQVGIYTAAYGLISRPFLMSSGIISKTLRPIYNKAVSNHNTALEKKIFYIWIITASAVAAVGILLILFLRKWIILLLLAEQYRSSIALIPWLAAGFAFQSLTFVFENYLYAHKHTKTILLCQSLCAVLSLAITIPLVIHAGMKGAAISCPIYFGLSLFFLFCVKSYFSKKTNLPVNN